MKAETRQLIADAINAVLETRGDDAWRPMEDLITEIIQRDSMDPDEQHRFRSLIDW